MDKAEIIKKLAELKGEVEKLEKLLDAARNIAWPTWPPPAPATNTCAKCGIQLTGVMMYVCGFNPCPSSLGSSSIC